MSDLVKSHVIPKFFFRKIKEGRGFYHQLSPNPDTPRKKGQTEPQERLFCKNCDTVTLRDGESYLADVLFETGNLHTLPSPGSINLDRLNYGRIQRCLLSILWRMSLSIQDYFKFVQLDNIHSNRIRNCILNGECFSEAEYSIMCTIPLIDGKSYSDWMLTPCFVETDGNTVYQCLMAGFLFTFIVGSVSLPDDEQKFRLKESGTWTIRRMELATIPWLFEYFSDAVNRTTN